MTAINPAVTFFLLLAASSFCWQAASAQETPASHAAGEVGDCATACKPEPASGNSKVADIARDIWNRPTLTGDWFGLRPSLEQSGITFSAQLTQFAFGVAGGVNRPVQAPLGQGNAFEYTGRGQYEVNFDLDKLIGLPHGRLWIRAENWFGEYGNVSFRTGSFAPSVFPSALPPRPNDPGVPFLTDFLYTQPLSKRLVVFAGKKNVVGAVDQDAFAGGNGTEQFVNQALIANPSFLLGLPYTSFTAGAVSPQEWGTVTAFVFDPKDRTGQFFGDNLFAKGVIVGGEVKVDTHFFGLPGQQHLGGLWKHHDLTDLQYFAAPPGEYPEPTVPLTPTIPNSYTIYHGFDQYLVQYSDDSKRGWGLFGDSKRGWGLFGRSSISDGNPTPVRFFLSLGLGGDSPFGRHRGDRFGIGWYYTGASTEFGPIPRAIFGPRDGTGVEVFYNFQVTPWLNITPDLQYIRPGAGAIAGDAFVYGLRVNTKF